MTVIFRWRTLFDQYDPEGFGEIPWPDFMVLLARGDFREEVVIYMFYEKDKDKDKDKDKTLHGAFGKGGLQRGGDDILFSSIMAIIDTIAIITSS